MKTFTFMSLSSATFSSMFRVHPRVSYLLDVSGKSPLEGTLEDPDEMPKMSHLAPLDVKELL